jgi:ubiquinone/menaquinone biosynthesis C-methylase UbiE
LKDSVWISTYSWKERYEKEDVLRLAKEFIDSSTEPHVLIIDIGCSDAYCTAYLKEKLGRGRIRTLGVDVSHSIKREAKKNTDDFIIASLFSLPFKKEAVPLAIFQNVAWNFLWHNRYKSLIEIQRILEKRGAVIMNMGRYQDEKNPKTELVLKEHLLSYAETIRLNWEQLSTSKKLEITSLYCLRLLISVMTEPIYRMLKFEPRKRKAIDKLFICLGSR